MLKGAYLFGDKLQITLFKDNLIHTNLPFSWMTLAQKWRVCEASQLPLESPNCYILLGQLLLSNNRNSMTLNSTKFKTLFSEPYKNNSKDGSSLIRKWLGKGIFLVYKSVISFTVEHSIKSPTSSPLLLCSHSGKRFKHKTKISSIAMNHHNSNICK